MIECTIHIRRGPKGSRQLRTEKPSPAPLPSGRVPRIARLVALAIKFDALVGSGMVPDYASLARVGHVSRARISQIMNLLQLAPDIQEQILFLPQTVRGRDPIHLHQLQPIAKVLEWHRQRQLWRDLLRNADSSAALVRTRPCQSSAQRSSLPSDHALRPRVAGLRRQQSS